ncbi:cationic amino acid transporter 2-like isoform X2 [Anopheles albimanus]|uniref:Cationic amino acid transporter C-terminal domain-containing protein n=1 Tax=Anopheles albimanus TaxID=7167 RepID=A0A182FUK5_ANOAL|nr:cationic amino acid transporter 2-like isoform X2 [Anopheles albimanus]
MAANLSCWRILTRRKVLTYDGGSEKLGRILNTFDLTALGVGATLGVGVYVLAGHVSKDQAGPSVVLSFLIAAAASFLAGLCYAEFGARVPKSGSAYIYSYVCIGEFMAFIIGWNLMLEYIIGSASVSRGLSLYIDTLANDTMKERFREVAPIEWDFMSEYFDFFAFSVAILLGIALAFGLKKSTMVNNAFTVLNLFIVLFVIVAGAINADIDNWRISPDSVPAMYNAGEGGFFPFGFEGTLRGAATCFFGFVGFDCIATTGEEVRNPRRAIPRAILLSLCTIFLAYFGVSTVLTLMWPYYKQDVNAPLPHVFNEIGWNFAKWIVAIGGIIGLVASLFGAMFPQPRIIYAMAQDGLIFRALGEVSPRFKTPVFGTLCAALLTGTLGGLFDLKALVNMLSIGTLMAYTVVAISILILRFSDNPDPAIPSTSRDTYESSNLLMARERVTGSLFCKQLFNLSCIRLPTNVSSRVVGVLVTLYCLLSIALALTIYYAKDALYEMEAWAWTLFGILLGCTLLVLLLISIQPREQADAPFRVPLVPLLPGISIFVNIYLMLMLDIYTWIRFGIWMAVGLALYAFYGFKNSYREVYASQFGWTKLKYVH